jgi:hypothetical protein
MAPKPAKGKKTQDKQAKGHNEELDTSRAGI